MSISPGKDGSVSPGGRTPNRDGRSSSGKPASPGHVRRGSSGAINQKDLITAMEAIRPESDKNEERIKELSRLPENQQCADCRADKPTWLSAAFGIFLCEECSTVHKVVLGHRSKVKCLSLAMFCVWDEEVVALVEATGNHRARHRWEFDVPKDFEVAGPHSSREVRENWIRAKYERLLFAPPKKGMLWIKQKGKIKKRWASIKETSLRIFKDQKESDVVDDISAGLFLFDVLKTPTNSPAKKENKKKENEGKPVTRLTNSLEILAPTDDDAADWITHCKAARARWEWKSDPSLSISLIARSANIASDGSAQLLGNSSNNSADLNSSLDKLLINKIENENQRKQTLTNMKSELGDYKQRYDKAMQEEKDALQLLYFVQERLAELNDKIIQSETQIASLEKSGVEHVPIMVKHAPTVRDDSASDRVVEKDGVVVAASLSKLCQLVCDPAADPNMVKAFFMTYRSFTGPAVLLEKLLALGTALATDIHAPKEQFASILNALEHWVTYHYYDFHTNTELVASLVQWLEGTKFAERYQLPVEQLKQLVRKRMIGFVSETMSLKKHSSAPPVPILPEMTSSSSLYTLDDVDPVELARQLTILEQELFSSILLREFLNMSWAHSAMREVLSPHLCAMIKQTNTHSGWIVSLIVSGTTARARARAIERFILMGKTFRDLNNFNGLMEVVSSMNTAAISRLKKTWELVNPKAMGVYEELNELISPTHHSQNYRAALRAAAPPAVPNVPIILNDLISIEEGMASEIEGLINFAKRRRVAEILLTGVQPFQAHFYNLQPVPAIAAQLARLSPLAEEAAFQMSIAAEPPASNLSPATLQALIGTSSSGSLGPYASIWQEPLQSESSGGSLYKGSGLE